MLPACELTEEELELLVLRADLRGWHPVWHGDYLHIDARSNPGPFPAAAWWVKRNGPDRITGRFFSPRAEGFQDIILKPRLTLEALVEKPPTGWAVTKGWAYNIHEDVEARLTWSYWKPGASPRVTVYIETAGASPVAPFRYSDGAYLDPAIHRAAAELLIHLREISEGEK